MMTVLSATTRAVEAPVMTRQTAVWWVLHTLPRMEKVVARNLAARGVPFFLPLIRVQHAYAKSRVAFEKPLFPGYVFLRGDETQRESALQTNRLVQVLTVRDQRTICAEIEHIERALAAGQTLARLPAIRVGARCRVSSGPLRGLEGVVVRAGDQAHLLHLTVTILGQSAVMEIDAALLEPVANTGVVQ